jgi:predicted enzyme related to lactoylglutathione lyase
MVDAPGSMWWAELVTRDIQSAKAFYSALLGWRPVDTLKYGIRYSVFKQGEESLAGLLTIGTDWGAVTPYWQVLFAVDDCNARVKRATDAGGSLVFGPRDVPNAGRAAIVSDPQHAVFVLMQPAS